MNQSVSAQIDVKVVSCRFGEKQVLEDLSFSLAPGEWGLLLGRNGSGKTTLLRLLSGLLAPDRGQVHISGKTPREYIRSSPDGLAVYLQESFLYADLTVWENIELTYRAKLGHLPTRSQQEELLSSFELQEFASTRIREVSLGVKQRAGLLRALVGTPRVILLDEPFSHLDKETRDLFLRYLQGQRSRGVTLLCAAHDSGMQLEEDFVHLHLSKGRIVRQ